MRLNKFLNENNNIDFNDIIKDCSDIIDIYRETNNVLFRGIKYCKDNQVISLIYPRNDRRPVDTPEEISDDLDDEFYKRFKWKPRREGVFCTSDSSTAKSFDGNRELRIVFPKNGFKFLWSDTFDDLFSDVFEKHNISYAKIKGDNYDYYNEWEWDYEKIVSTYSDKNIGNAVKSGNEVMIKCNYYYLVILSEATDFINNLEITVNTT